MKKNLVIGIEGLVGSGKTSICRELQNHLPNSILFHGGNVYRGIAYMILKNNININKLKNVDIKDFYDKFNIHIEIENKETVIYSGKDKIEEENLQSKETSLAVSQIANIANNKNAYKVIYDIINQFSEKYNVIFSGRDTMKIYPELDYHFFITASIEERVRRKSIQYKNDNLNLETIKNHILKRDKLQEDSGYYNTYKNTIIVDVTNCKTISDSTKEVLKFIKIKETV